MEEELIIPFGKYKDQPAIQIANDKAYCEWLMKQSWFEERFPRIHTLIINNFGETSETPEHNQLQAMFLSVDHAYSVVSHFDKAGDIHQAFEHISKDSRRQPLASRSLKFETDTGWDVVADFSIRVRFQSQVEKPVEPKSPKQPRKKGQSPFSYLCNDEFDVESGDYDKALDAYNTQNIQYLSEFTKYVADNEVYRSAMELKRKEEMVGFHTRSVFIELKDSISDDYPGILRTVKQRIKKINHGGHIVAVIAKSFNSKHVAFADAVKIFHNEGIRLALLSSIPQISAPSVFTKITT